MSGKTCGECGLLPICGVGGYRAAHPECPACAEWRPRDDPGALRRVEERRARMEREARRR